MPDTEEKKQEEKVVDIDTSGPAVDVELPEPVTKEVEETPQEDKTYENERETKLEDGGSADESSKKSDEQPDVRDKKDDKEQVETKTEEKKSELEEYSEGVKRRIAKLTKKMREAERQRDEATVYAKSVLAEKNKLNKRLSTLDTGYVSEMENRIKSAMEAAVSKLSKAREDGDLKSEVAAQTEISKLGYESARLTELKAKEEAAPKGKEQEVRTPLQYQRQVEEPINPDPKAQKWAQENAWFGTDEPMTFTAFALHKKLTEEEGYDPQTDEYYSEINRRIKLEFPHKFDKVETQTSKPTQTVASATRSSKTGRKNTVRLTPSQVAIAKKLGVPLEEYAKQLNITKEA